MVLVIGEVLKATPDNTPSKYFLVLLLLNILSSAFSGVVELKTQLPRLISILWLPLCRINKLGYSYPRWLLRFPTLVGHQDYFLAPLPGTIALLISSLDKYTFSYYSIFLQLLLSLRVDLIGKVDSRRISKNIIRKQ